jgi:YVTN family beta-propeller protein
LAPAGKKLYTANGESNDLSVIATGSLKVIATIPVGAGAWGVAMRRSFSR